MTLLNAGRKWRLVCKGADLCAPEVGAVAQLGERLVRNEEVSGSIPLGSTNPPPPKIRCPKSNHVRLPFGEVRQFMCRHAAVGRCVRTTPVAVSFEE